MAFVYILRCCDSSFYVGITSDLDTRLREHNEGLGGAYTFKRRPVEMVYLEYFDSSHAVRMRERQLKGWTRAKKEALIARKPNVLKRLSRRRKK